MKALCAVQRRTVAQNLVCEAYSSERQALAVTKGRETGGKRERSGMCGVGRSLYLSGLGAPVGQGLGDGTRPWPGAPLGPAWARQESWAQQGWEGLGCRSPGWGWHGVLGHRACQSQGTPWGQREALEMCLGCWRFSWSMEPSFVFAGLIKPWQWCRRSFGPISMAVWCWGSQMVPAKCCCAGSASLCCPWLSCCELVPVDCALCVCSTGWVAQCRAQSIWFTASKFVSERGPVMQIQSHFKLLVCYLLGKCTELLL